MSRTPLVAGNWKMHGTLAMCAGLVADLHAAVASSGNAARMLLCPPYPYLGAVITAAEGSAIEVGAQDLSAHRDVGAFTGEVAGRMLVDVGCQHAIVGHSERRSLFGEDDALVAGKFEAAQAAGLTPILCVGETLAERDAGRTDEVVKAQVSAVLAAAGVEGFATAVIAYEPLWAIGTGKTATPDAAQKVHAMIRALVASQDATIAAGLTILYGGSVKAANAKTLFSMPDIDGGLVGGASLDAAEFSEIFRAACG